MAGIKEEKKIYLVGIYCRLSKDDGTDNESASIATQKSILTDYVKKQGWHIAKTYVDDGYSGTNFQRPSFQNMIKDIESGLINCVITKDLSRLGRNYLDCGLYLEVFFPEHNVRYIAVNDGVDTLNKSAMDITPFRNILNEMYAADISVKIKSAYRARFQQGKFMGTTAPYGYIKDPADHNHLLIDDKVAHVVKEIFDLALKGNGVAKICRHLNKQHILRPAAYAAERGETGFERHFEGNEDKRYIWSGNSVRSILRSPIYAGNLVGYELAMKFTKGEYAFIVATHTDKAHIHNHIIFNSTNLACDRKFKNFFLSSFVIQRISDRLCLEHGLSVIKPRAYRDREKRTDYPRRSAYRDAIREAIDRGLARNPKDFEELLRFLEEEEYQTKRGQNPTIKGKDQKRFIRFKSLGEGYRPDDLEKIISGEMERDPEIRKRNAKPEKSMDMLIDIQAKLAQGKGAGYERWAKVFNVKQVAKALLFLEEHDIRDLENLNQRAKEAADHFNELSVTIKSAEKRMAEISVLRTHILNYVKTKDVYVAYRKSGYSKAFFEAHREEITLHKAAKQAFSELGVEKLPTVKQLNEEFAELLSKKKEAYREYRKAKQEMTDFATAKYDIERFLNLEKEEETSKKEKAKSKEEAL